MLKMDALDSSNNLTKQARKFLLVLLILSQTVFFSYSLRKQTKENQENSN